MTTEIETPTRIGPLLNAGYPLTGLVHIGCTHVEPILQYREQDIDPIVVIDPLVRTMMAIREVCESVEVVEVALGNFNGYAAMNHAGRTFLSPIDEPPPIVEVGMQNEVSLKPVRRWVNVVPMWRLQPHRYNTCVIDVGGMELDILRGMDDLLERFDYFAITTGGYIPRYRGQASVYETSVFLTERDYLQEGSMAGDGTLCFVRSFLRRKLRGDKRASGTS